MPNAALLACLIYTAMTFGLNAQTFNATLTGRAIDPSGAVVPGVRVTIRSAATGVRQTTTTTADGVYTFPLIPPGRYTLNAVIDGFNPVEITNIVLQVGARTGLDIELTVGASSASVQVTADAGTLQLKLESGERSEVITNRQIRDLALNGRNILDLMKVLPGVVSNVSGQVSNDGGVRLFNINGARGTQKEVSIDGSSNVISGANQRVHVTVNPDAIQEVKVLTSNYQAEYGKTAGGYIQYTTRSGGSDFHGGARYFRRHDSLNANSFFNNAQGFSRQIYRYNYYGYDIGGPVYIPGKFNRKKDKLFFFWNQEFYRQVIPSSASTIRVPTEAERRGDFSQTTDGNGNPVFVRDPLSDQPCTAQNRAGCFPNNTIPANRFFADGQKILNIYPAPNDTRGGARYNFSSQFSNNTPRREDIVRVDWNISSKTRLAGRYIQNSELTVQRYGGCNNVAYNFPLTDMTSTQAPRNASFNLVHTFTPTLINELTVAPTRSYTICDTATDKLQRAPYNIGFPLLFDNPLAKKLLPSLTFAGIANQTFPSIAGGDLPAPSGDNNITLTDNLSKYWGKHAFKTGFYFMRNRFLYTPRNAINGDITFSNDANNPLNTGHPYANALLGIYTQFSQANAPVTGRVIYHTVEGFFQDTWKIHRRLTLDLGLRVSYLGPLTEADRLNTVFVPERFDFSKAVRLYTPIRVGTGTRAADPASLPANPTAENTLPQAFVGLIVPNSGNPNNGLVSPSDGYPAAGMDARGPQWGPRVGFAWDVLGNGKTVVRGGFGISYERVQANVMLAQLSLPPNITVPRLFYGQLADLKGSSGALAPVNLVGYSRDGKIPNIYSQSIGIQRNLGRGTVVDVAYVGTLSRHLVQQRNLNSIPYFTTFQKPAQDPTRFTGPIPDVEPGLPAVYRQAGFNFSGANALPVNFLRPYPGIAEINYREFAGSSNYHALQVSVSRRLSSGLAFEAAYTWSKAMDTGNMDFDSNHPYNSRSYDYGLATFDRTHTFVANYVYDVPSPRRWKSNPVGKHVLSGWQISGISQFYTGEPFEMGLGIQGITPAQRIVGSYNLPVRLYRVGGAAAPPGNLQINPAGYAIPAIGDVGPYPRMYLRNPSFLNNDLSVFKNFPIGDSPTRKLQLRVEMFNFLNATEFTTINSGTQVVTSTGQIGANIFNDYTNLRITNNVRPAGSSAPLGQFFGEYNGARDPRIIQVAAKFYF
ncbi:MAG TPA: carboxypeptidase regulatory-like domain-containing protein [Bryobacteraceae bacterium]|nr:carboxypeptidase regulatory-like domain-containing protein [Bryobacteraceae bacterium]